MSERRERTEPGGSSDFFLIPEEVAELAAVAGQYAAERLEPSARDAEQAGRWAEDVVDVVAGFSLRSLDVPRRLGGDGTGCLAKVVLLEALAAGDAGGLPAADPAGRAAGAAGACPDRALAAEVLGPCLAGEAQAVPVVLDPTASAAQTRVEWAPAWPPLRWAWVSQGDRLRLVAVDDVDAQERALAFGASGAVAATLADDRVVSEWLLPTGGGVAVRGRARLWAGAVAVGVAQAAFAATVTYTTERVVFGRPVAHHQGNAFDLAAAATNLHGARLALRDAAASYDGDDPAAGFAATQAWLTAIDAAATVTDLGIQLLGGHGFLVDHPAEKRFREVRMLAQLAGGRDAAEADVADLVLDMPHPVF
jgi:alkylation response protein AidB-like acyl-CoA dehydrogenase